MMPCSRRLSPFALGYIRGWLIVKSIGFLCLFIYLIVSGCGSAIIVEDINPEMCDEACDNLADLGCEGAEGSPGEDEEYGTDDDVSCSQVCRETELEAGIPMHTECVADAESCVAADECFNRQAII